jgi:hypothetical protein
MGGAPGAAPLGGAWVEPRPVLTELKDASACVPLEVGDEGGCSAGAPVGRCGGVTSSVAEGEIS